MKLRIGWAEESIVPDKKVRLFGQFYERISDHVESEISVTAMAVESGDQQLILVSCDLTSFSSGFVRLAREKFCRICPGVDPAALVISATHTHTSHTLSDPYPAPMHGTDTVAILSEFFPKKQRYKPLVWGDDSVITPKEATEFVTDRIALAAKRAWEARADAFYTNEFGRAAVGMCRRVCYDDGSAQMWGDVNTANFTAMEGGNDSGIELLFTFDADRQLTGIVANIACPSQILEHRSFIAADYWGEAKKLLRERFGSGIFLLALCGAAGDQCPRDLVRWVQPETPINDPNIHRPNVLPRKADPSMFDLTGCRRVGRRIANEIFDVYDGISDLQQDGPFRHKVVPMDLPLRKATMAEYEHAVREIEYYVAKNADKDSFDFEDNARLYVYAGTIQRFREQQFAETYPIEAHVIRLGNIAFVTCPFELFLDYGNRIKARSYAEQTFIVQLCCGRGGYLPTEKAERGGHYSAYISSGNVGHEGGDIYTRKMINEINWMWAE